MADKKWRENHRSSGGKSAVTIRLSTRRCEWCGLPMAAGLIELEPDRTAHPACTSDNYLRTRR